MLRLKKKGRQRKLARLAIRKLRSILSKKKKERDNLPSVQQQIQGEGLSSFYYREFC